MKKFAAFLLGLIALTSPGSSVRALDDNVKQLVVGIAPNWNSRQGRIQCFHRNSGGSWEAASVPVDVLFGKNGLAWGRGVEGTHEAGLHKQEHDGRAPAGVFQIGRIYTYDSALPEGAKYPFHTVTSNDAWGDNPDLPNYNRFVTIPDSQNPPPWFEKEKMRQGDFAYRWLVEIRHNSDPPVSGAGSAIFFHIRRGETRPTSGCTTLAEPELVKLIRFLRFEDHPHYVLLPWSEYQKRWRIWGLPEPSLVDAHS